MMNPFPVVIADLRRSWSRCGAVICLIALATALGIAISAQDRALRRGSAQAADAFDLLIGARGSPTQLILTTVYLQPAALDLIPGSILAQLQQDPGVQYVAPIAFGDYYQQYPIVGSTVEFITQGGKIFPTQGRLFATLQEVVIGADVALQLGDTFSPVHGQPGEVVEEEEHTHEAFTCEVVGRMPRQGNPWDRAIIAPIEAVWAVHDLPTGHGVEVAHQEAGHHEEVKTEIGPPWLGDIPGIPTLVVKPKSVVDAHRLRNQYRTRPDTMALFPAEVLIELYVLLGDVRDLLAVISIGTQGLVIAAILLAVFASLASRRQQFAVLRALGASRQYIFAVVWCHISLMICAGALWGLFLGWIGARGLSWIFFRQTGLVLPVAITAQEMRMMLALIGLGMLMAVIPSWSSYRQSVTAALKS